MTIDQKQYENAALVRALAEEIDSMEIPPITVMEVCGTHTMSIYRYGLKKLLKKVRFVSGPGCPVCVTDAGVISLALAIARQKNVIFTSFGDMLRVPAGDDSLLRAKEEGADVRFVLSPLDALTLAKENPLKQVVFFAVGFETTAPLIAATVKTAALQGVENFSILCAHKTMPEALRVLLKDNKGVDALLCPGHVSAVTGWEYFSFLTTELHIPAAAAGFLPVDILLAVRELARMFAGEPLCLKNCYERVVSREGNPQAMRMLQEVFCVCDSTWRGIGLIPGSGLCLAEPYSAFDAERRFAGVLAEAPVQQDPRGCRCGSVLKGEIDPADCPLFGRVCAPAHPVGACMVSGEGSCAAAYKYTAR